MENDINDINDIIEASTATGSRIFGGYTDESDYDYIINPNVFRLCFKFLSAVDYERLNYKDKEVISYLFEWDDKKINFLIAKPGHYQRWLNATEKMVQDASFGIIYNDKDERVRMFNKYKDE